MRSRWLTLSVALIGAATAAAALVATSATPGARATSRTVAHVFQAFENGKIAPNVQIVWVGRGGCDGASWNDDRRATWFCGSNRLPAKLWRFGLGHVCFSSSHGRSVLCPIHPWSRKAIELRLGRPLGAWQSAYAKVWTKGQRKWAELPWGISTTNGKRCLNFVGYGTGGPPAPGIGWLTYTCTDGSALFGFPQRGTPVWTISYSRSTRRAQAGHATRVGISGVWR